MNVSRKSALIMALSLGIPCAFGEPASTNNVPSATETVAIDGGIAGFHVSTNIPAIEVSGKSTALQARVQIHRDGGGLTLDRIEAWLPVKTLNTGMAVRDEHMRKRIFVTSGGEVPDLRFESGKIECPGVTAGREATCGITGTLAIRGISRGFSIVLKVRQEGNGNAFRASGDGIVKLSDYGIEQPSQLGVKTSNEVKIHLDLNGKESPMIAAVGRQ